MKWLEDLFDFLASIKLAVVVILALAVLSAVGTIIEAKYDAWMAQRLVYQSVYMYLALGFLCVNLIAVMIDRWPWRPHHAGFVLAHIGILVLLFGSWLTQKYGIDGSLALGIGESNGMVMVNDRELGVYSTFDGSSYSPLYLAPVDFIQRPPEKYPFKVSLGQDELEVLEYHHFALRKSEIRPSSRPISGSAVRVQLQNQNVNLTEWVVASSPGKIAEVPLGPAKLVLSSGNYSARPDDNVIEFFSAPESAEVVNYRVFSKSKGGLSQEGSLQVGDRIETGWMGLQLRLLRYLPQAEEHVTYEPRAHSNNLTQAAIKIRFRDREHWVGLNSVVRLYDPDQMLIISFGQRRIDLGFQLHLAQFNVGRYQGTMRASSYESEVDVPDLGARKISMNEPLKFRGLTFYQASFEQDESGRPTTSVLSVNYDPGRWIKYLGSLLIVLGSVVLFYFKRVQWLKALRQSSAVQEGGRL